MKVWIINYDRVNGALFILWILACTPTYSPYFTFGSSGSLPVLHTKKIWYKKGRTKPPGQKFKGWTRPPPIQLLNFNKPTLWKMLWNPDRWEQAVRPGLHYHSRPLFLRRARNRSMASPNRHHRQHKASKSLPRKIGCPDWSSPRPRKIRRRNDWSLANWRWKWLFE